LAQLHHPEPQRHGPETEVLRNFLKSSHCPDGQRFLLETRWSLRLFDRRGAEQWQVAIPSAAWSVNIASSEQVAVTAFADGTIRWYRRRDGQELLVFFPHNDRKRWVLWTPSGYYDAAPGAEDLIGWHVNRGRDQEADFFPVGQFRTAFYRPDVVARVFGTGRRSTGQGRLPPQRTHHGEHARSVPVGASEGIDRGRQTPTTTKPPSTPDFPVALVS
jgi:hypothetical protein